MFCRLFFILIIALSFSTNIFAQSTCKIFSAEEKVQLAQDIFGIVPESLAKEIKTESSNSCCISVSRPDYKGKTISDCFCICPGEISNTRWGSLICQAPFTKFYPASDVKGGLVSSCEGLVSTEPVAID